MIELGKGLHQNWFNQVFPPSNVVFDTKFQFRESLNIYHQLIPKCMASWNLTKAVEVAEMKLATMERISDEMMTLLPSTLLELYEMYSLAKVPVINGKWLSCFIQLSFLQVMNHKVSLDMESLPKRASQLSSQFGDRFVSDYTEKISQIEQECKQVMLAKTIWSKNEWNGCILDCCQHWLLAQPFLSAVAMQRQTRQRSLGNWNLLQVWLATCTEINSW